MHRHDNNVVYIVTFVFSFNIVMIRNKIYYLFRKMSRIGTCELLLVLAVKKINVDVKKVDPSKTWKGDLIISFCVGIR